MADQIHTFIIEIPPELEFNEEDIALLKGRFQEDAGLLIDQKEGIASGSDLTNIGRVNVITKVQEAQPPEE